MAKRPYIQFFVGDWIRDTRFLPAEAKGAWIDTLCLLHDAPIHGMLSQPVGGWARLWGIDEKQADAVIEQLADVAEVVRGSSNVLICCRRMVREALDREQEANKKRRQQKRPEDWSFAAKVSRMLPGTFPEASRGDPDDVPDSSSDLPGDFPPDSPPNTPESRVQRKERERVRAETAKRIVDAYPRREKVVEAMRLVDAQLAEGEDPEAMLAGTKACAAVLRTLPSGPMNRFAPGALSFFRDRRWADDPATMKRQGNRDSGQGQMDLEEAKKQLGGRAVYLDEE